MTTALAPVDKVMLPSRSGRRECWSAVTTDGTWSFGRQELPGTPWAVVHRPTGIVVDPWVGTLDDCRAYVASGEAQRDLERIQAHERGEHENERDKACPRC
jgi:hypothetical protein